LTTDWTASAMVASALKAMVTMLIFMAQQWNQSITQV
jgi:hypothetical protein